MIESIKNLYPKEPINHFFDKKDKALFLKKRSEDLLKKFCNHLHSFDYLKTFLPLAVLNKVELSALKTQLAP